MVNTRTSLSLISGVFVDSCWFANSRGSELEERVVVGVLISS